MVLLFKLGGLTADDFDTLKQMERDIERECRAVLRDHKDFTNDSIVIVDAKITSAYGLKNQEMGTKKTVRLSVFVNPKKNTRGFKDIMPLIDAFADEVDDVVVRVCEDLDLDLQPRLS